MLINEKHLAVVRAALHFFEDEMGPHGDSFECYLSDHELELGIVASDMTATRELFASLIPRQAMLDTKSNRLATTRHVSCEEASQSTPAKHVKYVTLLVPDS